MSDASERITANIAIMNSLESFDVVIVCCGKPTEAAYWQGRLSRGKGSVIAPNTTVLAVHEDWPGGAGNALGTLYAYQNAVKLALSEFGMDLNAKIGAGEVSVALYHTAGKGTRMAPMPGAENNNKPGVKLPAKVNFVDGSAAPITILESVVKQTGCYAKSRMGRLSVFWGDQVFIPTVDVVYTPAYHADILCSLGPMMDEAEWAAKGMDKYGLIALTKSGKAAQVEKVTHTQALDLLSHLDEIQSVGASLGSFSVSGALLFALLEEFSADLAAKAGKLDSDPHLWMPFTLERDAYCGVMGGKGVSLDEAGAHYDRMAAMLIKFNADKKNATLGTFGPVDVGQGPCWWDYGQLKLYQKFSLLMTEDSEEGERMRSFFNIDSSDRKQGSTVGTCDVDTASVVNMCDIGAGSVKNCVLTNVRCKNIDAEGCILMNVTAESITAREGSIVYNVVGGSGALTADAGDVQAGVTLADGTQVVMRSKMSIDGGKAWDQKVEGNPFTFGEVHGTVNATADPAALEKVNQEKHAAAWAALA